VTAAATRTGALAMGKLSGLGTIEGTKRADLLLLNANPLEDVRNFGKIDQMMMEGEWCGHRASLKGK
jgi:imidazolonepropionase-like amidohydrolase